MNENALVSLVDVQKSYDGKNFVIEDLNLNIIKGEFLTLLGPSGSCKTTCLMMLAGFETATYGEIYFDGKLMNNVPPYKRDIGMVFQNYALFPHMSVGENIAFPLDVRGIGKIESRRRVEEILAMVQMSDFIDRRPKELSGGQQQRIALARAIVFEPKLLLMDEPLGALDKNLREQMQYEIKRLHDQLGFTVVYVTHDQSEALTMSNRIAVFNAGKITQLSSPSDLYEYPENSFTADFIGENNCLKGAVVKVQDDYCMVRLDDSNVVKAINVDGKNKFGDSTLISLRPERSELLSESEQGEYENMIEGTVEETFYLGDHTRVHARITSGDIFIIKQVNDAYIDSLKKGDNVRIVWDYRNARALCS